MWKYESGIWHLDSELSEVKGKMIILQNKDMEPKEIHSQVSWVFASLELEG